MNLITRTPELIEFCHRASESVFITVDTEFVRETTYWPQLCLIQVGLEKEAAAIDPLSENIDLKCFFDLLMNKKVLKVFHSGRQDIEMFYHLTGEIPEPIFDTQIAAMVCGFGESIGYDVLAQKFAHVTIDKSSRYTHWAQRPLTDKQLAYALGDVTHLRVIYKNLYQRIVKDDRLHWLEDEESVLTDPSTYAVDPYGIWQKIRVRSPRPRMLAILREIAAWREITAQKRNIPRSRVVRDEAMIELSAAAPSTIEELKRMRGIPPSLTKGGDAKVLLELIGKASSLPIEDCPQIKKYSDVQPGASALLEMLRMLLKIKADKYQVAQKLIATTSDLEAIAKSANPNVPALQGWRREVFGNAALALKEGKVAIGILDNRVSLISLEKE